MSSGFNSFDVELMLLIRCSGLYVVLYMVVDSVLDVDDVLVVDDSLDTLFSRSDSSSCGSFETKTSNLSRSSCVSYMDVSFHSELVLDSEFRTSYIVLTSDTFLSSISSDTFSFDSICLNLPASTCLANCILTMRMSY